ncbi:MAG: Gfo/Idh/MocA family oxidoreductase [Planctomycetota bacterium]|nr:MAG: Gfo/Idh/MocA family oxidoreductase [Planctomycetota bacterium]
MVNIGVVGIGHWGPNHVRNFSQLSGSTVVAVADTSEERRKAILASYPEVTAYKTADELFAHDGLDAVVIATPTATHYELVKAALGAGLDVLAEKPLAVTAVQCRELDELAKKNGRVLMVGHVFLFNSGILKLKECSDDGSLGKVYYGHATRVNLGPIREDVGAVFDLATHDISIFNYIFGGCPTTVSASGKCFLQKELEDLAFLTLTYPSGQVANVHVSWLDPKKIRTITLVGDRKMVTWDDLDPVGPIHIYDKSVIQEPYYESFGEFHLLAREGDITIPKVKMSEPLRAQSQHFIDCISKRAESFSDGAFAAGVVAVLEATQKSIEAGGAPVEV